MTRLAALFILALPAQAATIPPEVILTDAGFRQLADCTEIMQPRVWRDGHYWSVRPGWDCTAGNAPYGGGKGDWFATDEDLLFLPYRVTTVAPAPIVSAGRSRAAHTGGAMSWTGYGGTSHDDETDTTIPSPVPLPATLPALVLALAGLWIVKRKDAA